MQLANSLLYILTCGVLNSGSDGLKMLTSKNPSSSADENLEMNASAGRNVDFIHLVLSRIPNHETRYHTHCNCTVINGLPVVIKDFKIHRCPAHLWLCSLPCSRLVPRTSMAVFIISNDPCKKSFHKWPKSKTKSIRYKSYIYSLMQI